MKALLQPAIDYARIYDLPDEPPPVLVSGFGPKATSLAARVADGFVNDLILTIAIVFGTINVVGGFLVTDRMLEMFKKKD